MIENYIDNFENIVSSTLFATFKVTLIILVSLLILSLVLLAIEDMTAEKYTRRCADSSVCHIFEKILKLKNLMLTKSGKEASASLGFSIPDGLRDDFPWRVWAYTGLFSRGLSRAAAGFPWKKASFLGEYK